MSEQFNGMTHQFNQSSTEPYGPVLTGTSRVCPNCGYCPHCGRGAVPMYPLPQYPTYPTYPTIPQGPIITW